MPGLYDPQLGLPVDEDGNVLSPEEAGSDHVSEPLPWQTGEVPARVGEGPGTPSAPPLPANGSVSVGGGKASYSHKGITEHGKRQARGVFGQADQAIEDYTAKSNAQAAQERQKSQQDYANLGEATQGEINATSDFATRDRALQDRLARFQANAAEVENRIAGESRAERASYISMYQQQLAGVRALAAQSGNPLGKLSTGEMIGLAGAQFAQGFLAAQGIHIDVSGQVDRWVERSIQEHQMAIQNARASAEDTMHLYEIARQNSQDDWEARQRYRGFVIAGLQTSIQANASRFQSDIAMARAREQVAKLQIDADATERAIGDRHEARVNQFLTHQYDRAFKQGTLAIESEKAAIERDKLKYQMNKDKAQKPDLFLISDPEPQLNPATGKKELVNRWAIRYDDKDAMEKARDAHSYTESVFKQLNELESLRNKAYAKYGGAPVSERAAALASPEVREYLRQRKAVIMTIRQATTGKAFTKEETKEYEDMLPNEHAWQVGDNNSAIQQVREKLRSDFESKMDSYSVSGAGQTASPETAARSQAIMHGQQAVPSVVEQEAGKLDAKDSGDIERDYKHTSSAWAEFKQIKEPGKGASDAAKDYAKTLGQPSDAVAIDHLADAYARPQFYAKVSMGSRGKAESPEEIRAGAYEALKRVAHGELMNARPEAREYAKWMLDRIDNDEDLQHLMHGDDVDSPLVRSLSERK